MKLSTLLTSILCMGSALTVWCDNTPKSIRISQTQQRPPSSLKPHKPAKIMLEAWLTETELTILFLKSEGEATITIHRENVAEEKLYFSTDIPFVIDITPYPDMTSFTINTETGSVYEGYFN